MNDRVLAFPLVMEALNPRDIQLPNKYAEDAIPASSSSMLDVPRRPLGGLPAWTQDDLTPDTSQSSFAAAF